MGDAEVHRIDAGVAEHREQHRPVGVADLPRGERALFDQLVAGREDAHTGPWIHADPRCSDARQQPHVSRAQHRALPEHGLARGEVATRGPDVVTGDGLVLDDHPVVAVAPGPLDHHDGVRAVGDRRAGHDPDRLARPDRRRGRVARRKVADDTQPDTGIRPGAGGVGGAERVTVHRRVREGRDRFVRGDVRRQHEPERVTARPLHRCEGFDGGEDLAPGILERNERHAPYSSPRSRTIRARNSPSSAPRSGRSSASSMLARRKSTFLPMS